MPTSASANRRPLLVVEDDADLCDAIHETLAGEGFEVVDARDGQAALDYLRANPPPPVILLDWNMAPVTGAEFMAEVAKDRALSAIPVVLLTADMRADEMMKSRRFAGLLRKPINLDSLLEVVGRFCG
jgi:CheY-like chemotaxis protein